MELIEAAKAGDAATIVRLLATDEGEVAAVRDVASAELLLDAGAEPDARQQLGYTALHAAAQNDDEALAVLLLRHGADPSLRNEQGATARSIAEARESTAVLA